MAILGINYYNRSSGAKSKSIASNISYSEWDNKMEKYILNQFGKELSPLKTATSNPTLRTLEFLSSQFPGIKTCGPSVKKKIWNETRFNIEPLASINDGWILTEDNVFLNFGTNSVFQTFSEMNNARYVTTFFGQCSFKTTYDTYIRIPSSNFSETQLIFKLLHRYVDKKHYIKIAEKSLRNVVSENLNKKKQEGEQKYIKLLNAFRKNQNNLKSYVLKNPKELDVLVDKHKQQLDQLGSEFYIKYSEFQFDLSAYYVWLNKTIELYLNTTLTHERIHMLEYGQIVEAERELSKVIDEWYKTGIEEWFDNLEYLQTYPRIDEIFGQLEFMGIVEVDYDRTPEKQLLLSKDDAMKLLKEQGKHVRSFESYAAITTNGIVREYDEKLYKEVLLFLLELIGVNNRIIENGILRMIKGQELNIGMIFKQLHKMHKALDTVKTCMHIDLEELTEYYYLIERVNKILEFDDETN